MVIHYAPWMTWIVVCIVPSQALSKASVINGVCTVFCWSVCNTYDYSLSGSRRRQPTRCSFWCVVCADCVCFLACLCLIMRVAFFGSGLFLTLISLVIYARTNDVIVGYSFGGHGCEVFLTLSIARPRWYSAVCLEEKILIRTKLSINAMHAQLRHHL